MDVYLSELQCTCISLLLYKNKFQLVAQLFSLHVLRFIGRYQYTILVTKTSILCSSFVRFRCTVEMTRPLTRRTDQSSVNLVPPPPDLYGWSEAQAVIIPPRRTHQGQLVHVEGQWLLTYMWRKCLGILICFAY